MSYIADSVQTSACGSDCHSITFVPDQMLTPTEAVLPQSVLMSTLGHVFIIIRPNV
jgi:hypothetical protein